jgi:hypothetical protein
VPIHNLGYREWNGTLHSPWTRWMVVAEIGIRRAWQSAWLRRMMFFAWVPGVVMGFMIFLFEQAEKNDGAARDVLGNLTSILLSRHGMGSRGHELLRHFLAVRSDSGRATPCLLVVIIAEFVQAIAAVDPDSDGWIDRSTVDLAGLSLSRVLVVLLATAVENSVHPRQSDDGHRLSLDDHIFSRSLFVRRGNSVVA